MLIARLTRWEPPVSSRQSGRSSGVEHNLAKVGVEGSNPFARSSFLPENQLFEPREAREGLVTTVNSPGIVTTLSPVQFQLGTIQACSRPSQPNQ